MVAAMCMVLYGYDASVFNSVQGSDNWLKYFDLNAVSSNHSFEARLSTDVGVSFRKPIRT